MGRRFALLCLAAFATTQPSICRSLEVRGVNTHYVMKQYASKGDWESRASKLRNQILSAAGLFPLPPKNPLNVRYVRHFTNEFCNVDTLLIETMPGFHVGANLYTPLQMTKKMPAVLIPHGHWKKGRIENIPDYSVPALGMNLARQGYIVFAFDMVGYNDTTQLPHDFVTPEGELWSYTPMGLQLWNSIRALDFLTSLPHVDSNLIAVTGASGGATQTILLTAVDDRVKYSAPVNMISAYMQGGDPCEEAPGLRVDTFNVEIAALAAPRPMHVVSCTGDWTKHTPEEEYPAIRKIYDLFGRTDFLTHTHFDAHHNYNAASREAVYRFLSRHMQASVPEVLLKDYDIGEISEEQFLAKPSGGTGFMTGEQIFQQWKSMAREQSEQTKDKEALRERLRLVLHSEYPRLIESGIDGDHVVMSRPGFLDRVEAYFRPGKQQPILLVNPDGVAAARASALVKGLMKGDRPLLILDTPGPNFERQAATATSRYFYSYNIAEGALRVQDILTGLAFLKANSKGKPQIVAIGPAGVWSLFAAAVAPIETELVMDLNGFGGTDEDFLESFFVPGIQRAGGLQAALRLTPQVHTVLRFQHEGPVFGPSPPPMRSRRGRLR
jgi:dienelactone hydrolase